GKLFHIDLRFQGAVDRFEKVVAMILDVKAQQVIAEKTVQDFILVRTNPKDFAVGPGDVPEMENDQIGPGVAKHARQQSEVIVLDKNHGRLVVNFVQHRVGELAIDSVVLVPVAGVEMRPSIGNVTQRPKSFVGKPV